MSAGSSVLEAALLNCGYRDGDGCVYLLPGNDAMEKIVNTFVSVYGYEDRICILPQNGVY